MERLSNLKSYSICKPERKFINMHLNYVTLDSNLNTRYSDLKIIRFTII